MYGAINRTSKRSTGAALNRVACAFFFGLTLLLAQNQEPLVGVWQLNLARSTFPSGPQLYARLTCTIEPWQDGLKVTYDIVGVRGGVTHWEWQGRLDGKDYPLQGVDEVTTNAYTRLDALTYGVVTKLDGRMASSTRIVISPDGRTMTVTGAAATPQGQAALNTAIYDKR